MLITHNSKEEIQKVVKNHDCEFYKGCLYFTSGKDYNLAGETNFKYHLEVDNVLEIERVWFQHDYSEVECLLVELLEEFGLEDELTIEDASELIDETQNITDVTGDAEHEWIVQQYQGLIAHALGYDCAESQDEQGTVYIAYCVDRKLRADNIK